MALCISCGSGIHEREDCPYREIVAKWRSQGVDVTTAQLRKLDDAAREPGGPSS